MAASSNRVHIGTHYVIKIEIEKVTKTGDVPYQGSPDAAIDIRRDVSQVGTAVVSDSDLNEAIDKATAIIRVHREGKP